MYLHLGQDTMINTKDVIGIFDLDTSKKNKKTREYLKNAEQSGIVINTSTELPKSFVVMDDNKKTVYISQLSPPTLKKRVDAQRKIGGILFYR